MDTEQASLTGVHGSEGEVPQRGEKDASRPQRWSANQKTEVVLRLLRGEDLEELSREIQVPAHVLEDWRRVFLKSGEA